jgi:hypothetical protein
MPQHHEGAGYLYSTVDLIGADGADGMQLPELGVWSMVVGMNVKDHICTPGDNYKADLYKGEVFEQCMSPDPV